MVYTQNIETTHEALYLKINSKMKYNSVVFMCIVIYRSSNILYYYKKNRYFKSVASKKASNHNN